MDTMTVLHFFIGVGMVIIFSLGMGLFISKAVDYFNDIKFRKSE